MNVRVACRALDELWTSDTLLGPGQSEMLHVLVVTATGLVIFLGCVVVVAIFGGNTHAGAGASRRCGCMCSVGISADTIQCLLARTLMRSLRSGAYVCTCARTRCRVLTVLMLAAKAFVNSRSCVVPFVSRPLSEGAAGGS